MSRSGATVTKLDTSSLAANTSNWSAMPEPVNLALGILEGSVCETALSRWCRLVVGKYDNYLVKIDNGEIRER